MTGNERQEVGCVYENEASPVLPLMVQMRQGERMGDACGGTVTESGDVKGLG